MSTGLRLRRHLYEQAALVRGRRRRTLRKQIRVLSTSAQDRGPDDGGAGVREPRRPPPSSGPTSTAARPPHEG